MKKLGLLILALSLAVPLIWFIPLAGARDATAVMSQYIGSCALIVMAWSQFMATRLRGLESVFGGLDRIYVLHKWLGVAALGALFLHDTIDADVRGLGAETFLTDLAETFGEIGFYGLIALVVLSIATFVPYHLWRYTHKLMGAFFALGAVHYAFILKPFSNQDPLGLYVLAFCVLGVLAYLYTLVPWQVFQGRHEYTVNKVEHHEDAISLTLTPTGRGMDHKPGQFAFIRLEQDGLDEVHPFTISSPPDAQRQLRFTIKSLGDYSHQLAHSASAGSSVRISGPFGHFQPAAAHTPEIWIAGGIGITPFLAWSRTLRTKSAPVHLFYSLRSKTESVHLEDLEELDRTHDHFHLHLIETSKGGRLILADIASAVDGPLARYRASFCGPKRMRDQLRSGLISSGLKPSRFVYEEFEIRSGIGIRKLLAWLFSRFLR